MDFASVRIITDNVDSMVEFYENVTGVTADRPAPVFAELRYPSCTLALGHTSTAALFNNAARPAHNQSAIIEWVVDDVDAEYERLSPSSASGSKSQHSCPGGTAPSSSAILMATSSTCSPLSPTTPSTGSKGSSRPHNSRLSERGRANAGATWTRDRRIS